MKNVILLLVFFASSAALAATVNLNIGDSITLSPNTSTTVTCGLNGGSTCATPIKNLKAKFSYCKSPINSSVSDCIEEIWPTFKSDYRSCVDEAFEVCLNFCKSDSFGLPCLDLCK